MNFPQRFPNSGRWIFHRDNYRRARQSIIFQVAFDSPQISLCETEIPRKKCSFCLHAFSPHYSTKFLYFAGVRITTAAVAPSPPPSCLPWVAPDCQMANLGGVPSVGLWRLWHWPIWPIWCSVQNFLLVKCPPPPPAPRTREGGPAAACRHQLRHGPPPRHPGRPLTAVHPSGHPAARRRMWRLARTVCARARFVHPTFRQSHNSCITPCFSFVPSCCPTPRCCPLHVSDPTPLSFLPMP